MPATLSASDQLAVDYGRMTAIIGVNDPVLTYSSTERVPLHAIKKLLSWWDGRLPDDGLTTTAFRNTLARLLWYVMRNLPGSEQEALTDEPRTRNVLALAWTHQGDGQLPQLIKAVNYPDGERPDNAALLVAAVTAVHSCVRLTPDVLPATENLMARWVALGRVWAMSGVLSGPTP